MEKELLALKELHNGVFIDLHPIDNVTPQTLNLQVRLAMFWSCVGKVKSGIYFGSKKRYKFIICFYGCHMMQLMLFGNFQ